MKERYQVLVSDGTTKNCDTKKQANDYIRECKKKGLKADLWDTLDNPLSRMFKL